MNVRRIDTLPEKLVLAFSPGYCCWHCEKPLPPAFTAVYVVIAKGAAQGPVWLFLTCGQVCQEHVLEVCCHCNLMPEAWSGSRVRQLLDHPEKIAGIFLAKAVPPDLSRAILSVVENASIN